MSAAVTTRIAVVGAGSWGTALAHHAARLGAQTRLWAREPEVAEGIERHRRNPWYLSDVDLHARIEATTELATAADGADAVIVAVPSEFFGATVERLAPPRAGVPLISATKGFDPVRHLRMTQLLAERFPAAPVAALSGPTFAREVALGLPTAAVVASEDESLARDLQRLLGAPRFRLYTSRDVTGVETGGAVKNVIAVAAGLADGLGLGENARAALVTRGLAEMTRLAAALGGLPATMAGLAGLGDLVLTCTGTLSRNHALGMALARGERVKDVEARTRMVAEGARTVGSALVLARRHGVALPITTEVAAVLLEDKSPADALSALLARAAKPEDG